MIAFLQLGLTLAKTAALRIMLNLDGSSSNNPVYERNVNSSYLGSSLSSHRQSYIGLVFNSRFIDLIINKLRVLVYTDDETTIGRISQVLKLPALSQPMFK